MPYAGQNAYSSDARSSGHNRRSAGVPAFADEAGRMI